MPRFPRLSIASKLYAIFALLATATVVLALVAVVAARRHAALTVEFDGLMSLLGGIAILLGGIGALVLRRAVVHPLAEIVRVTEQVVKGNAVTIPYGTRRDEIGTLSRSISVFQDAMGHNQDLNKTVLKDAELRGARQEHVAAEIAAFTNSIERNIAELGAISDRALESATHLAEAADGAARRTEGATAASAEASSNVRDIASATDELAASVMEIDRQVAQSNAIAEKAVSEAERSNAAVQELNEAAKRIGDVVSLITDIAEQTNLLALNATIEAARAGEAGRGFAVVAGEVKALAGQTAKATEDIATQIAGMQYATSRSIEAIEAIERTIRDIGSISGAIAAAVTEQGAATQEIARSVDVAAKRTHETAEEVSRVGDATENTRANVTAVRLVAEELGAVAHRIRDQIEAFSQSLRAA
jgi:methyl-accepting chemotaxis protein